MAPKRKAPADAGQQQQAAGGGGSGDTSPASRHCFLQAMMARQYLTEAETKELYRQITGAANDMYFQAFVGDVNHQLAFAQFELRRVKYLGDGQHYWGFVNNAADEDSKRSVKYRLKDGKADTRVTAYFKALLDRIAASSSADQGLGYLSSREALNLSLVAELAQTQAATADDPESVALRQQAEEVRKLGMSDREAALAQLTTDGWLAHMPQRPGSYTLGPRSFLELNRYIMQLDLPAANAAALQAVLA